MKNNIRYFLLAKISGCIILFLLFFQTTNGQNKPLSYTISLQSGNLITEPNAQYFIDSIQHEKLKTTLQILIQFYQSPNAQLKNQLQKNGIQLMDYLGANAYTALFSTEAIHNFPYSEVRSIYPMQAAWKTDEKLKRIIKQQPNSLHLAVSFVANTSTQEITSLLNAYQATVTNKKFAANKVYEIEIKTTAFNKLLLEPKVKYCTVVANDVALNNDERAMTGTDWVASAVSLGGMDLDGTGVIVGVGDNTPGLFHVDTRDRVTNFNTDPPELHGQHVTGTIAGKGIMNPNGKGLASGASVLAHLYNVVWAQTQPMFQDYGMTLTNNSYAAVVNDCSVAGTYDLYSKMLDDDALQFPKVLNVFAAGNDGNNTCSPFPKGYGTIVGIYQTAKNVLTVSSLRKPYTEHEGASKGPVKDGRLKPEVVSFGAGIYSCDLDDKYIAINGTSMACPGAVGCAALITQRYKQIYGNQLPDNALVKALIINGAVDVLNPGPDFIAGFGLINVYKSLQILNNNHYFFDSITSSSKNFSINIPANTAQLKVLLYWNDVSASPNATTTLVNDLDVTVTEPNGTLHHPLILNTTPANVTSLATEGVDHLNNSEQVVINNPQQGSYTITVSNTIIPTGSQSFYAVYDFIPVGLSFKNPANGSAVIANSAINIFWDASDDLNSFTLEYSDNNGTSWNVIDNNIAADKKYYTWNVPNIITTQALLRLKRNNTSQQTVSGSFVINPQPVLQPDAVQCPGYFGFNWTAVANVSGYQVLQKIGDDLQPIDTVTATSYLLKGLPLNTMQYVAVAPIINGKIGYRSMAIRHLPDSGNCNSSVFDNDLRLVQIVAPQSGRIHTSTALSSNENLQITIQNLGQVAVSNFKVSYQVNTNGWQSQTFTNVLNANTTTAINVANMNLAAVGLYTIAVAIENLSATDPVKSNDTMVVVVKQLANDSLDIQNMFVDDFETASISLVQKDEMGILPGDHWDFTNSTDSGRLRTFIENDVVISGNRSVSMDLLMSLPACQNYFLGTFNLKGIDVNTTEARLELDYKLHGHPQAQDGNDIYIRGNDTLPWVKLVAFDTSIAVGQSFNTGSLSITNSLKNNNQNFSSSFQVRIGQKDTSCIAANDYGNGLTIDNFKLYSVKNDVQLLAILNPENFNCGLNSAEIITVKIYNSDNLPQKKIQVYYRLNSGSLVAEMIDSLGAKDTVDYSFQQPISITQYGEDTLDVWLVANGDTYLGNDSVLQYTFQNQPVISSFPYLENFEKNEGNWFTKGINNSWQYGTPSGMKIKHAASGSKAWCTNLSGSYNNNEVSYLYSPCFDLSQLENPMLSFSLATDIENCGNEICDKAYVEFSEDGNTWTRLGTSGSGTNWYNNATAQIWNEQDNVRWRVASQLLPKASSLKLRFVFTSDMGATREGMGVDDIHIFDLKYPVYDEAENLIDLMAVDTNQSFLKDDKIIASLSAPTNLLENVKADIYPHTVSYQPFLRQYYISQNIALKATSGGIGDNCTLRLFVTDKDFLKIANDNKCSECEKPADIYRMGVLKYEDGNEKNEDGSWLNNTSGKYSFTPYDTAIWVPYANGYYVEFTSQPLSEFWITTGIPQKNIPSIEVYPNPVLNNLLYVNWVGNLHDDLDITICDLLGREIAQYHTTASDFDNITTLTLPSLASGVYVVKYRTAQRFGEVKITIR